MSSASGGSSSIANCRDVVSVSSSVLQSTTTPVFTASAQSTSNTAVVSSASTSSVQVTATANGNAAAMGPMNISGSPGVAFGAVGYINSLIINPAPNSSSSSSSSSSTVTTATEIKDKLNDVKVALCKFYSSQSYIANSIDGNKFPLIKVQLSLATERCEENNSRDIGATQDDKDAKAQSNTGKYREDWYRAKKTIEVEKLFELTAEERQSYNNLAHKSVNKVRVVGPAGIGKTIFTQYVAHKWATAGLWNDRFKYVFWIKLRNLVNYAEKEDPKISYIIFKECLADVVTEGEEDSCRENIKIILDKQREQTLLILDGYDEITGLLADTKKSTKWIFNKFKQLFPNLILTSRPHLLDGLHGIQFDRKLENCGFSSEQITEYVDNYFAEQKDRAVAMKAWLESREMVMGLAHIPVNLNILCALSDRFLKPKAQVIQASTDTKDSKESKDIKAAQLPTTIEADEVNLVTIYREMVGYFLYNHYFISNRYVKENDIVATETNHIEIKCANELTYLGNLALKALQHEGQTIIQQDIFAEVDKETDAKKLNRIKNSVLNMGLLRTIDNRGIQDRFKAYEFLHFSFQEFLAARYLVQLLKSDKKNDVDAARKFFRMEKYNHNYYMVFSFAAGLVHLEDKAILEAFWQELLKEPLDITGLGHIGLMIRCLDGCMLDKRIPNVDSIIKEIKQWMRTMIGCRAHYKSNFIFSRVLNHYFIPALRSSSVLFISCICDEIFVKALEAEEKSIREAALDVIRRIGEKTATPAFIKWITVVLYAKKESFARRVAIAVIISIGKKAVMPEILEWINTSLQAIEEDVRKDALYVIEEIGKKAITPEISRGISAALHAKKEYFVRRAALDVLRAIGKEAATPEVLEWISTALKDAKENVKEAALDAITSIGEKAATAEILVNISTVLETKAASVRKIALGAIEKIGTKAITPEILRGIRTALEAKEEDVRKAALDAITRILEEAATMERIDRQAATPELMEWISIALNAKKENVREVDLYTIEDIREAAISIRARERKSALYAIRTVGEKAVTLESLSEIATALETKEENIRKVALDKIKSIGEKAATPEILRGIATALQSKEENIKKTALYAIRTIGERAATPEILSGITQVFGVNNRDIVEIAVEAICAIGAKKTTLEILAKIIEFSTHYFNVLPDNIANYLLSVSLVGLLKYYLHNSSSAILLYSVTRLAIFKNRPITIADTGIKIYGRYNTNNIDLPNKAANKKQRIAALKQAFGLKPSQNTEFNSVERLLRIITTDANGVQAIASVTSSSSSSFFGSNSKAVSSSSSSIAAMNTSFSSASATHMPAFSCSAAESAAAKVATQEETLRAVQLNLRKKQNFWVTTAASNSTSLFSSGSNTATAQTLVSRNDDQQLSSGTNKTKTATGNDLKKSCCVML